MRELTAPNEGSASSPTAIADELSEALVAFDRVDYNALTHDELRELLDVYETVQDLCLQQRRNQPGHSNTPAPGGDTNR